MDSRLIHAGGANDSSKRRVLFYLSFKAKQAGKDVEGSLYDHLRREKYTLEDIHERVAEWSKPLTSEL